MSQQDQNSTSEHDDKKDNQVSVGFETGGGQITAAPTEQVSAGDSVAVSATVGGVDLEAHAGGEAHAGAGAEVTDTSVAATAEAGVSAEAGASATTTAGDVTLTGEAHVSAEANASANASAGWDGRNASATASDGRADKRDSVSATFRTNSA